MRTFVRGMLWLVATIYAALFAVGLFGSEKLIFQPQPSSYADSPSILKLKTADGKHISAMYLPDPKARFTLLFSHGNAEDLGDNSFWFQQLHDAGFAVFAYDYHGYGTSEGEPTEKAVYMDVDAAYDYLTQTLHVPPARIISFGRSVGSGPAVDLASRRPVAGLIIRSGFSSAFRVLTHVRLLPFDRFDNISKIKKVKCPVLIMHGRADEVIPFWHGEEIFNAAHSPKMSFWLDHAGHNDFERVSGQEYFQKLETFADSLPQSAAQ